MVSGPVPDPRPGAFGKLPLAADFVSVNAGGPGVRGFTEWLQEGVGLGHARLGGAWDASFPRMPAWRFLLTPGGEGESLAGVMVAGRDRSGRKFPFVLFTGFQAGGTTGPATHLAGLVPFLDRAESEALRLLELSDVPGPAPLKPVAEAVAGLPAALPATAGETPSWPAMGSWSGPDGSGPTRVLSRVGANLLEVATRVGAAEGRTPAYGLRAPVPGRGPEAAGWVRFWVELTGRALASPRALFWSAGGENAAGTLDLYFRPPGTTAFLHLVDPDLDSDTLYPLDEADPPRPGPAAGSWAAAVVELSGRPGATLGDALGLLGGGS